MGEAQVLLLGLGHVADLIWIFRREARSRIGWLRSGRMTAAIRSERFEILFCAAESASPPDQLLKRGSGRIPSVLELAEVNVKTNVFNLLTLCYPPPPP